MDIGFSINIANACMRVSGSHQWIRLMMLMLHAKLLASAMSSKLETIVRPIDTFNFWPVIFYVTFLYKVLDDAFPSELNHSDTGVPRNNVRKVRTSYCRLNSLSYSLMDAFLVVLDA